MLVHAAVSNQSRPRLIKRELAVPHRDGCSVFPGFISYASAHHPTLIHRYGWVNQPDIYDRFSDSTSMDNGQNWSMPKLQLSSRPTANGLWRYLENAAIIDSATDTLITLVSCAEYTPDRQPAKIQITAYDRQHNQWSDPLVTDMGLESGLHISFCYPIQLANGRILVPAYKPVTDEQGRHVRLPGYPKHLLESMLIIGQRNHDGHLTWRLSETIGISTELSSRGLCEPTICELHDGRIAMICRGDNGYYPDRPGCKWACFSENAGDTWSQPQALAWLDGSPVLSSSTGSAVFRSLKNNKLYWIGNICPPGESADGNWPRSPLVIAQIMEDSFRLLPDTLATIDSRQPGDGPRVQFSNFRYYQDRATGDVLLYMTRLGERQANPFGAADYYQYRIELP